MDMLWYSHKHGLVPDADYDFLWNKCQKRHPSFLAQGSWQRNDQGWAASDVQGQVAFQDTELEMNCTVANRKFLATTSQGLSQGWSHAYINELDLFTDAAALDWTLPGTENYYQAKWLNDPAVRKALHVESSPAKAWPGPPSGWEYKSSYDACNDAPEGTPSMVNFYQYIAPKLKRTIVFNGDVDPCVSYEGTRAAIEKVGFPVVPGGTYRPWFYDKKAATTNTLLEKPSLFGPNLELHDAGAQFGGQIVNYEHNLSFATVHGSGHMVPQFRPQAAERLLNRLLSGEEFTPLLATDAKLGKMTDSEYAKFVDTWTLEAEKMVKTSPTTLIV
jgi:cathepsin A (carboxypeptidase C)